MKSITYAWEDGYGVAIKAQIFGMANDMGVPMAWLDVSWFEDGKERRIPEMFVDAEDLYELSAIIGEAADMLASEGQS